MNPACLSYWTVDERAPIALELDWIMDGRGRVDSIVGFEVLVVKLARVRPTMTVIIRHTDSSCGRDLACEA